MTYGASAIPTTVLIDRKGIVRYIEAGNSEIREEEIRKEIEKLLAEK
jgi:peroxiredoxin